LRLSHARAMRHADKVIFISEFVRQDAIRWFGSVAQRGIVIPNPISWDRFAVNSGSPSPEDRPYILSVAAHYAHKQLDVLLKAFAEFSHDRPDYCLVLVGQLAGNLVGNLDKSSTLGRLIAELQLTDRVRMTGYITDAELGNYYRHAAAFAFPTVFEGFGMPVVEALGFGLPCLTTRCTAIPETTLGLATYLDNPADVGEWASRLQELVDAPRLSPIQIQQVRNRYAPLTIGHQYKSALSGNHKAQRVSMPASPVRTMIN
jgi:glycosyltransferase involved in cell wall biosynthesis